jgi:hypothetical protein
MLSTQTDSTDKKAGSSTLFISKILPLINVSTCRAQPAQASEHAKRVNNSREIGLEVIPLPFSFS